MRPIPAKCARVYSGRSSRPVLALALAVALADSGSWLTLAHSGSTRQKVPTFDTQARTVTCFLPWSIELSHELSIDPQNEESLLQCCTLQSNCVSAAVTPLVSWLRDRPNRAAPAAELLLLLLRIPTVKRDSLDPTPSASPSPTQYNDQLSHRSRNREPCTTPVSDPPIHPGIGFGIGFGGVGV